MVSGVKYTKGKTSIEHGYANQKGWYTQRPTCQESAQHNVKGEQATEGGDEEHEICISASRDPIGEWYMHEETQLQLLYESPKLNGWQSVWSKTCSLELARFPVTQPGMPS